MTDRDDEAEAIHRASIAVSGLVQGVGFRPFVWRLAQDLGLTGSIRNDLQGVTIEVQGPSAAVQQLITTLKHRAPSAAHIDDLRVQRLTPLAADPSALSFDILPSDVSAYCGVLIAPELATCDECLSELWDPSNRRFRYPFINCTQCGPRYTLIEDLPYDRSRTTMRAFSMCSACQREYSDPTDRRFHAQPNACPECGPRWWLLEREQRAEDEAGRQRPPQLAATDIEQRFATLINSGAIIAVKGLGGFHLVCDATQHEAVCTLRERKGRPHKPLAVMVRDLAAAEQLAEISPCERQLLTSSARPIVLLKARPGGPLSPAIAPAQRHLGLMLPYSPLHHLLLAPQGPPLVMTSANISQEPIEYQNERALDKLQPLVDAWLLHDRDILVPCEDSLVRCVDDRPILLRRARGFAPRPLRLVQAGPPVLAVGGELKGTACLTNATQAFLTAHAGDVASLQTLRGLQQCVRQLQQMLRIAPEAIVVDMHPGYLSTQWGTELAQQLQVPLLRVQHHHAHLAALLADHELSLASPLIACCFDGSGWGLDQTLWGGEFFISGRDYQPQSPFVRFAHLKPVALPGGDAGIQRPYRMALAHLQAAQLPWLEQLPCVQACSATELSVLSRQLQRGLNCIPTSSIGRLFDAVAALAGVRQMTTFEGQAAVELEAWASHVRLDRLMASVQDDAQHFRFDICMPGSPNDPVQIDMAGLLGQVCKAVCAGQSPADIAAGFHSAVAAMVLDVCCLARAQTGIQRVGLTGGVFQNAYLLQLVQKLLSEADFEVLIHRRVPANDGGLALGQAVLARAALADPALFTPAHGQPSAS